MLSKRPVNRGMLKIKKRFPHHFTLSEGTKFIQGRGLSISIETLRSYVKNGLVRKVKRVAYPLNPRKRVVLLTRRQVQRLEAIVRKRKTIPFSGPTLSYGSILSIAHERGMKSLNEAQLRVILAGLRVPGFFIFAPKGGSKKSVFPRKIGLQVVTLLESRPFLPFGFLARARGARMPWNQLMRGVRQSMARTKPAKK